MGHRVVKPDTKKKSLSQHERSSSRSAFNCLYRSMAAARPPRLAIFAGTAGPFRPVDCTYHWDYSLPVNTRSLAGDRGVLGRPIGDGVARQSSY